MRSLFILSVLIASFWCGSATTVHAQSPALIPPSGVFMSCDFRSGDIHFSCIPEYIGYLIKIMVGFAGAFFFFGIIIGGYKFALKSASQEKQAGIRQIMYSFIGVTVAVLSYLIVDTLMQSFTP